MSYATLMVYVDADAEPERRVHLAATLADKFSALLIGLSSHAIRPPLVAANMAIQDVTEAETKAIREKLAGRGHWFRNIAEDGRRMVEWRSMLKSPGDALACEARSADLIVIGQFEGPGDIYSSLDPAEAILRAGRPMLIVPNGVNSLGTENVVIGWKDSREARRAVQDALPLLHQAGSVTIVELCEPGEEEIARQHIKDVARYLERHRIKGGPEVVLRREGTGAAQLIRLAHDAGAGVLVTGAYGHSRLGEWIFGGMTRELLASSPICCLMSH